MSTDSQPQRGKPSVRSYSLTEHELGELKAFIHTHNGVRGAARYRAQSVKDDKGIGIKRSSLQWSLKHERITREQALKLAAAQGVKIEPTVPADQLKQQLFRALRGECVQPSRRGRFIGTWTGRCKQRKSGKSKPTEIGIWLDLKQVSNTPESEIGGAGRFTRVSSTDPRTVEIRVFGGFLDAIGEPLALQYRNINLSEMEAFGAIFLSIGPIFTEMTGALAGFGPLSNGWVCSAFKLYKQTPADEAE